MMQIFRSISKRVISRSMTSKPITATAITMLSSRKYDVRVVPFPRLRRLCSGESSKRVDVPESNYDEVFESKQEFIEMTAEASLEEGLAKLSSPIVSIITYIQLQSPPSLTQTTSPYTCHIYK